jgi:hypothetical protein
MGGIKVTPCRDMVFVCDKTFKVYTRPLGKSKSTTRTTRGNLRYKKEAKFVQSSRDLEGGILVSDRKRTSGE